MQKEVEEWNGRKEEWMRVGGKGDAREEQRTRTIRVEANQQIRRKEL